MAQNKELEKDFILLSFFANVIENEFQHKMEDIIPDFDFEGSKRVLEELDTYNDENRNFELVKEILNETYNRIKPYIEG